MLRAGEEGSGLALSIPGAESRCRFHHEVVHGIGYRHVRLAVWHVLQLLRRGRRLVSGAARRIAVMAIAARDGVEAGIVSAGASGRRRAARARGAVRGAVGPPRRLAEAVAVRDAVAAASREGERLASGAGGPPRCTPACLTRCVRMGLSAGVEGSGLGLTPASYCRFHRALLESDRGMLRRTIAAGLTSLRAMRARAARSTARLRAFAMETQAAAAAVDARIRQPGSRTAAVRLALPGALARAAVSRLARGVRHRAAASRARVSVRGLALRRFVARARPQAWWPALRQRARVRGEVHLRRTIDGITEFLVWAVPKPKPPVRSVAHVSLISHKQYMLSRLARNHGLKGTFLAINTYPNAHLKIGFDYEVPMNMDPFRRYLRASWYLWRVLAFHDVIHYHFNGFLFDDGTDLRVLKRMGKVIVVHYRGCDLRCRSINTAKNPELNVCQECSYPVGSCDTDYQRNKITISRTYSDIKFVTTPDLLDFSEDAEHLPFIAPYAIDFSAIEPAPRTPGVFRVVTSSNHPALDGVRFVREAVDRLIAEGVKIELVEIYRQAFHDALALYKSADLYCGKLRMGYYNNANIESLMLGVPNMCYIREQYLDRISDSPIIVARPDNVYEKLREWVAKPEELKRLGAQGPDFVRRHHHADELMVRMIARYNAALERKLAAGYQAAPQSSVLH